MGSEALLVELTGLDAVLALRADLADDPPPGVRDLVAAARTLLIGYDPAVTGPAPLTREVTRRALAPRSLPPRPAGGPEALTVPVRYDGADLAEVARRTGLTPDEVIARHTAPRYTVAFAGFAPGFGYLTGTDPLLALERRAEPRTEVPAGSVAVAGGFTGVYPRSSPGGWHLLGTTTLTLWDERRDPPALLIPGRTVRLRAVG
ncbi:allophanate hydrolase subunit 1 [Streptomyces sp. NPDC093085]|uniref:5-oxoprolinase subunit B family protein n=1 Tax=Streptomyces sp. NPDC093085 TaxID=3155068 RepID=UPI003422987F